MSVLTISVQHCSRVLARTVELEKTTPPKKKKDKKENERDKKERRKKNYFYFANDIILCIENPLESLKYY